MHQDKKIFIAGHKGMVGSAIMSKLIDEGFSNIIKASRDILDLTDQSSVRDFFTSQKIDYVFLAAAKVGGINANNSNPADFIYENLMIQSNVIKAAHDNGVKRLLFLGSSCIYPKNAKQPITENEILSDHLEPTNEPYAIAKISGIKLCESFNRQFGTDFRSIMPTNLYGYNDNFNEINSHVIPGLIYRFHKAKINNESRVAVWGSGVALREFLFVEDMADASIFVMNLSKEDYRRVTMPMLSHINIGSGEEISIKELSMLIKEIIGFKGEIVFDENKPDGPLRKCVDSRIINNFGWSHKTSLEDGILKTYKWFINQESLRL
jgi:GDP-L-fucose synthase